jgi:hypothetical protein
MSAPAQNADDVAPCVAQKQWWVWFRPPRGGDTPGQPKAGTFKNIGTAPGAPCGAVVISRCALRAIDRPHAAAYPQRRTACDRAANGGAVRHLNDGAGLLAARARFAVVGGSLHVSPLLIRVAADPKADTGSHKRASSGPAPLDSGHIVDCTHAEGAVAVRCGLLRVAARGRTLQ